MIRTVVLDFDDFSTGWSEKGAALVEAAGGEGRNFRLIRVPEPVWNDGGEIGEATLQCNSGVLDHLRLLDFGRFESADQVIASGVDLRNMYALYQWYSDIPFPRPGLTLHFTRTPWHYAEKRRDELMVAMKDLFESWPMMFAVSARFSARSQALADAVTSAPGFHPGVPVSAVPCPPGTQEEAGGLVRWLTPAPVDQPKAPDGVRVLLYVPFGEWGLHHQFEAVMGRMLRNGGHFVHVIACDELLKSCPQSNKGRHCLRCQYHHRSLFQQFELPESRTSAWVSSAEADAVYDWAERLDADELMTAVYDGFPAGRVVASTLYTYYRITSQEQARHPSVVRTHREFLAGAVLSYKVVERAIEAHQIDRVFLFNGRLFPYQAALMAAHAKGIDVFVHERGPIDNSFQFFENMNSIEVLKRKRQTLPWLEVPLTKDEIDGLDSILRNKIAKVGESWPTPYAAFQNLDDEFFRLLDLPTDAKIIGYFTSSPDELCQEPGYENVYEQFEAIDLIAKILEEHGYYLIVRHHPNIGGTLHSECEITGLFQSYEQQGRSRQKNLRILLPNDPVASSSIFPYLDGAIALYSSIATEMVASGIPTLTSPISEIAALDRPDDLTILDNLSEPALRKSLKHLLELSETPDKAFYQRCFRSVYLSYGRLPTRFSVIGMKDTLFHADFGFESGEQLVPGLDPELDKLYDRLVNGGSHFRDPGPEEKARNSADEDRYLEERMTAFRARSAARIERRTQNEPASRAPSWSLLLVDLLSGANEPARPADNLYGYEHRWLTIEAMPFAAQLETLREHLHDSAESWVWLGTPRFRLNGTFATRVGKTVHSAGPGLAALPLTGWFSIEDHIRPARFSLSKLDREALKTLPQRAHGMRDPASMLGLVAWEKSCLVEHILPALGGASGNPDYLLKLLSALAEQATEIADPVFFNY